MSAENPPITGLMTGGFIGLVIGFMMDGGVWSVASAAGCAWICNGVSGLMKGELYSFIGRGVVVHCFRDKEPITYWIRTVMEIIVGCMVIYAFFFRDRLS